MPFIGNYSRQAVHQGLHFQPNRKAVLIQISDVNSQPLDPMYSFKEIHRFWFDDAEDSSDGVCITQLQAKEIAAILRDALRNVSDVVVNCHAGICRSGAITEVGVMLGFQDAETERIPNQLVKKMLMQELGLSFDPELSVFNS